MKQTRKISSHYTFISLTYRYKINLATYISELLLSNCFTREHMSSLHTHSFIQSQTYTQQHNYTFYKHG